MSIKRMWKLLPPPPILNHRVELLVQLTDVLLKDPALDKAFLRSMKDMAEGGGDRAHNRFGNDPIISVGNGDRTSVRGEEGAFLGDKKEKTVVIAVGGEDAGGKII